MKSMLLICLVLFTCVGFSQEKEPKDAFAEIEGEWKLDDNGNVSFTKIVEIPDVNKDELFTRAMNYFAYNYKNGDEVIQVKDKEQGLIVGKGIYGNVFFGGTLASSMYDVTHILRIDVKDAKARIILSIQEYKVKVSSMNRLPTYYTNLVSERFPFAKNDRMKKQMYSVISNTYKRAMDSLVGLEKSLKVGNTSVDIENSDW